MKNITRVTTIGIPAMICIGLAWVGTRLVNNEKELKNRELELKLHLETKSINTYK